MDTTPHKIIFRNGQCPGDLAMLAYAIKSLHESHPNRFITDVRSPCPEIFEGNKFITHLNDNEATHIDIGYTDAISNSNQKPYHFVIGFLKQMERLLQLKITPANFNGFIDIRDEEKRWYSAIYEIVGKDVPYWIIDAGYKKDYTAKKWDHERFQKIVDSCPDVQFVQIGVDNPHHVHKPLIGNNLINLIGKTDLRQLIRLIWNAYGVITPVSMPMVLAYGIPAHPRFKRLSRACIVIAGGREPNHWQQGPNQQYLHTCGMLSCCDYGGCWKSRVVPLGDGDNKDQSLCINPVKLPSGDTIAKCMDMISAEEVITLVRKYMDNLNISPINKPAEPKQISDKQIKKEITLNVVHGIGDIFWVYQKFAPHVDRINFNLMTTVSNDDSNHHFQTRAVPFVRLFPKVGDVGTVLVTPERYQSTMRGLFNMDDVLQRSVADYACNNALENGIRIEAIDPNYAIESVVQLPEDELQTPSKYIVVYVSKTTMFSNAIEYGVWDVNKWVEFIDHIRGRCDLPIIMIGADYDKSALDSIKDKLGAGSINELYIDLPARKVVNLLRKATYFIGHQSGLNIIADNLGTPQTMLYMKHYENMLYTWCRTDDKSRFKAALFTIAPSEVADLTLSRIAYR